VVPEDPSEHIALDDDAAERTRPLRDESSFIDNFFASGETPTPSAAPGKGVQARTAVDARAISTTKQADDELTDGAKADDLGVRLEDDHASTNTSASASGTRTPTRTQSRFSSWFHDPPQEGMYRSHRHRVRHVSIPLLILCTPLHPTDSDSHVANSAGSWGAQSSSESWRRRPSEQTRR
jgi:hypothetical protein